MHYYQFSEKHGHIKTFNQNCSWYYPAYSVNNGSPRQIYPRNGEREDLINVIIKLKSNQTNFNFSKEV